MKRLKPTTLFNATAVHASKLRIQGLTAGDTPTNANFPKVNSGDIAAIVNTGATQGVIFAPSDEWKSMLLDFAFIGAVDISPVVEIGKIPFNDDNALNLPLASVALKTGSAYVANKNPFTGEAIAATTFRLVDLVTINTTPKGQQSQVLTNIGGLDDDVPSQLILKLDEAAWYYVIWLTASLATGCLCVGTPHCFDFGSGL